MKSSEATGSAPSERSALRATVAIGVLAGAIYLLTGQLSLHGTDWRYLVLWAEQPGYTHPQHPGYLALAKSAAWLGGVFGATTVQALAALSAIGGGLAVALVHRLAWEWRRDTKLARVAALLALWTPGWWHHATVVEMHAPFAAVAMVAAIAGLRWWRGGFAAAAATGAWTGLATWVHATGHFWLAALAVGVWWLGGRSRRRVGEVALATVVHLAVWGGLFWASRTLGRLPDEVLAAPKDSLLDAGGGPLAYLLRSLEQVHFATSWWPTVVREWLEPFAPCGVLALLALANSRTRPAATAFVVVLVAYLAMAMVMLDAITDERGAYLLPMAVPAIGLVLATMPRVGWWPLLLVAFPCALLFRGEPGRVAADVAFGRALVSAAAAGRLDAVWFVGDYPQMDGAQLADPRVSLLVARKEYEDLSAQGWTDPAPEQIAGWLALKYAEARQAGKRFVVLMSARAYLAQRLPRFAAGWDMFATNVPLRPLPSSTGLEGHLVGG